MRIGRRKIRCLRGERRFPEFIRKGNIFCPFTGLDARFFAVRIFPCRETHPVHPNSFAQEGISADGKERQITPAGDIGAQEPGASGLNLNPDGVAVEFGAAEQANALVVEVSPGAFLVVFA